jgi:hypothetical protein
MTDEQKALLIEYLKSQKEKMDNILSEINNIMWSSYMVKERGIKEGDCDKIMELLEQWAND